MNKEQRATQERLAWHLAVLARQRCDMSSVSDAAELAHSINLASKALYEFHERMIEPAKPKAARKPKALHDGPTR